jgi:CheY-like chemotaxis protein
MLLEFRGFRALVAESGAHGLALYQENRDSVKAIVTDMKMPAMHGMQVIQELRRINPDARIVAMSGIIDGHSRFAVEPGRLAYLPKPMTSSELVGALQSVLAAQPATSGAQS